MARSCTQHLCCLICLTYLGFLLQTGRTVAIKKIRLGKYKEGVNVTALREIKLLKELHDPHVIELIDVYPKKKNLNLVFEFMTSDLEGVSFEAVFYEGRASEQRPLQIRPSSPVPYFQSDLIPCLRDRQVSTNLLKEALFHLDYHMTLAGGMSLMDVLNSSNCCHAHEAHVEWSWNLGKVGKVETVGQQGGSILDAPPVATQTICFFCTHSIL